MATTTIINGPNGVNGYVDYPHTESRSLICYGWITSSATELHIYTKPMKSLIGITNITVTALNINVHFTNATSLSGDVFSQSSNVSANVQGKEIHIALTKKSGETWGSNNTHFTGSISTLTYTLS